MRRLIAVTFANPVPSERSLDRPENSRLRVAFFQLNTDLEKKLQGVAGLEIADRGGFTVGFGRRMKALAVPLFAFRRREPSSGGFGGEQNPATGIYWPWG
jgi:hypothetical protein